ASPEVEIVPEFVSSALNPKVATACEPADDVLIDPALLSDDELPFKTTPDPSAVPFPMIVPLLITLFAPPVVLMALSVA
ncbi:MAG: hypothetical protein ACJAXU_001763, partial [Paracoccaceae bacterium]